jgi:two-component system chemotaxis response regulator CheB
MTTAGAAQPAVELVVLVASAGGLDALSAVLHDLPADFGAAVVVQQHLGGRSSVLPTILGRASAHRPSWAVDGRAVEPGQIVVCPPNQHMELRPSGAWRMRPMASPAEHRFDVMLASVASSFGARGLAVVLSGSSRDGAAGTEAMKRAGAIVIAQSPDTAAYPSMPIAAAEAGADLVLPVSQIGRAVAAIVGGAPLTAAIHESYCAATSSGLRPALSTGEFEQARPVIPSSLNQLMEGAASRAEAARLRADELRRRRQDLAAGLGATAETVIAAQRKAKESKRRAQLAHQAASQAAAHWGR